jgi:hypothetical protein
MNITNHNIISNLPLTTIQRRAKATAVRINTTAVLISFEITNWNNNTQITTGALSKSITKQIKIDNTIKHDFNTGTVSEAGIGTFDLIVLMMITPKSFTIDSVLMSWLAQADLNGIFDI